MRTKTARRAIGLIGAGHGLEIANLKLLSRFGLCSPIYTTTGQDQLTGATVNAGKRWASKEAGRGGEGRPDRAPGTDPAGSAYSSSDKITGGSFGINLNRAHFPES